MIIDPNGDGLCLGEHGHVITAIDEHGKAHLWLAAPGEDGPIRIPRHELEGRLPRSIAERVWQARCGAERADGGRCRQTVARPGERCHHHPRPPEEIIGELLGGTVIATDEGSNP